jgi:hypothetical protein
VVLVPGDLADRRPEPHAVGERPRERLDVALRATADGAPPRAAAEAEHPVVVEELGQEAGGEAPHLRGIGRPHGRRLGDDQAIDEGGRIAAVLEPAAQRRVLARGEQPAGVLVEAHEVGDHAVEPGRDQVCALGEQAVGRRAVVLEVATLVGHREGHARGLRRDLDPLEQALEAGVVAVVEDDEARVHVVDAGLGLDRDGVRVAARVRAGLEHRDLVGAMQEMGGDEA